MADLKTVGAARAYLQQKFGGLFTEIESNPIPGAAESTLVKNNPDRLGLLIVNMGANLSYIALSTGAGTTKGIVLGPNGGSVSFNVDEDFTLCTREFRASAPAGNSQHYVLEIIRELRTD